MNEWICANPWISQVSGVGWGILLYKDFAMAKETEQGVTFTYKFVTTYTFNCHSTIALKNS